MRVRANLAISAHTRVALRHFAGGASDRGYARRLPDQLLPSCRRTARHAARDRRPPEPRDPEIRQRIADLGAIALHGNAGQFGGMLTEETTRWRKVVELSGMKKE